VSARRPKARLAAAVLLPAALILPATPAHAATATAAVPAAGASTLHTRPADADAALNAFIRVFWDPKKKYFFTNSDRRIHPEHAYGPENGRYTDFWWEAQLWELVMDAYQRTRRPEYRRMIDDVYAGFVACYPDFENDFNDDIGWWAMAATRAYEITGNRAYLDRAKTLFDRIWAYHDDTFGGGIWWKNTERNQKNVATNAPAVVTAVRLYTATRDPAYLARAKGLYDWIDTRLQEDGHVYDHFDADGTLVKWDFTYNFGNYISAATALYEVTGERSYLDDAIRAADWATTYLTNGGTLMNEGVNDGGGFKTLLIRGLHRLVTRHGQRQYLGFLQHNVNMAWGHRRRSDNLVGPNWSAPTPTGHLQSLTASAAVAALQLVPPDGSTGVQPENGVYEAENAITTDVGAESSHPGYTGRGYLAGWSSANQYVTFHVNVAANRRYDLVLRYSGGAGDAGRRITVNDRVVAANHTFPGTGDWGNWSTTTLRDVRLKRGHNTIRVDIDPGSGNGNWLNFDQLRLAVR
jgi:Predicted glycosyl hydrolase